MPMNRTYFRSLVWLQDAVVHADEPDILLVAYQLDTVRVDTPINWTY
jgi:hypothetical protein